MGVTRTMITPLSSNASASAATARLFAPRFPATFSRSSTGTRGRLGGPEFLAWALERITIRTQQKAL
jgi:hypothetical protein